MQIVSLGDNLHEMSYPVLCACVCRGWAEWGVGKKKNIINLSSAEAAQKVVKVTNGYYATEFCLYKK